MLGIGKHSGNKGTVKNTNIPTGGISTGSSADQSQNIVISTPSGIGKNAWPEKKFYNRVSDVKSGGVDISGMHKGA